MKNTLARWFLIMSSGLLITACQNNKGGAGRNNGAPPKPDPQKPATQEMLCNQAQICLTEQDLKIMRAQVKKSPSEISEADLVRWQANKLAKAYEEYFRSKLGDENSEFIIELFNIILGRD